MDYNHNAFVHVNLKFKNRMNDNYCTFCGRYNTNHWLSNGVIDYCNIGSHTLHFIIYVYL